ncbi:MAG: polysaccharide deacetylase family protein, partial [Campylobacter sp.]|nr:polysaccharide deacetylase family protein [Campylobacter sp.]
MYHSICEHEGEKFDKLRVKPSDFEKQIAWLSKNDFKSFKFSELISLKKLPQKAVCITFDDGFEKNFTHAFEILKKYNFKATIFLVPKAVENSWDGAHTAHISKMLSKEQILLMQSSNLVEFGAHTLHHVNLTAISLNEAKIEICDSKAAVEKITGKECEVFAYPYGKFNDEILAITMQAGFKGAVVVKRGIYEMPNDLWQKPCERNSQNSSDGINLAQNRADLKNNAENLDVRKFTVKRIGILGTESFFD